MAETILYDAYGIPLTRTKKPPEAIAGIGRVRDPFTARELRDLTPETTGRLLRDDAPLHEQQLLIKRVIERWPHAAAVLRDLVLDACSLDWEVTPFRDDGESGVHTKRAAWVAEQLYAIEEWDDLLEHLVYGEAYPYQVAETLWNDDWLPGGFELIDAHRITRDRDRNQLRLLTREEPRKGVELSPHGFIVYRRRVPLWKAFVLLYLIQLYTITDWLAFAEKYGKPIPIGKYSDATQKPTLIEAMQYLSSEFVGVFPVGVEIELKEAQRYGSIAVFEKLVGYADDTVTILFLGHKLIAKAEGDNGTLAGNGARKTNLKVLRAVSRHLAAAIRTYLIRPLVGFHFGWDAADELPQLKFKWEPAEDQQALADTYEAWNRVLEPTGEAIDPKHVQEVAGIPKTVKRQAMAAPAATAEPRKQARRGAAKRPRLATTDDVETAVRRSGGRAVGEVTDAVLEQLEAAESIEEFADVLWEKYSDVETIDLAELLYGGGVAAHALARRETDEEAGS